MHVGVEPRLWVLETCARKPLRLANGPRHATKAAHSTRRDTGDFGTVFYHTFLLETNGVTAEPLEALIPDPPDAWEATARPAPDGTYLDAVSRSAVVVRDGAIVAIVDL